MILPARRPRRWRQDSALGLLALLGVLSFCLPADAQTPETPAEAAVAPQSGILKIRSEPSGVLVHLLGEHRWTGTTPWELRRGIDGTYRVVAHLDGYEGWKRTITIGRGESRDLDIRLVPKAGWKAGLRSMIVPGWGQAYGEKPAKGALFLAGTALAAGGLVWANEDYRNRVDDYESARNAYLETTNIDELDPLRAKADRARGRADRAYDRRQALLYATVGLYAASLLDAVLLFPGPSEGSYASLSPWGTDGPQLALAPSREGNLTLALRWTEGKGGVR